MKYGTPGISDDGSFRPPELPADLIDTVARAIAADRGHSDWKWDELLDGTKLVFRHHAEVALRPALQLIAARIQAEMLAINSRYQGTTEAATGYLDGLRTSLELATTPRPPEPQEHRPAGDPMTFATYCVLDGTPWTDNGCPTAIQWALIFDQRQYGPFPTKQAATVYGHALYTALPGDHEFETTPLITPTADLLQR